MTCDLSCCGVPLWSFHLAPTAKLSQGYGWLTITRHVPGRVCAGVSVLCCHDKHPFLILYIEKKHIHILTYFDRPTACRAQRQCSSHPRTVTDGAPTGRGPQIMKTNKQKIMTRKAAGQRPTNLSQTRVHSKKETKAAKTEYSRPAIIAQLCTAASSPRPTAIQSTSMKYRRYVGSRMRTPRRSLVGRS